MYDQITSNKRKSAGLLLLFFIVIIALGYWASYYFEGGQALFVISIIIATGMSLFSYFKGDAVALAVARARQIQASDDPYVYRMVENLTIAMGLPMPKVYLIDDPALNAFATGRDPQHASVAITTGLVQSLENEELEGVIAHELSHIKNFDIRLMTVVIICVGIIALFADIATRRMFWGGGIRSRDNDSRAAAILAIVGIVLIIVAPIFAQLIQFAVSRKREFLADASGALATRYPEGLARALEKISHSAPVRNANRATAHLYIANPFKDASIKARASTLFSTHPPIEERIKRLRETT